MKPLHARPGSVGSTYTRPCVMARAAQPAVADNTGSEGGVPSDPPGPVTSHGRADHERRSPAPHHFAQEIHHG